MNSSPVIWVLEHGGSRSTLKENEMSTAGETISPKQTLNKGETSSIQQIFSEEYTQSTNKTSWSFPPGNNVNFREHKVLQRQEMVFAENGL